MITVLFPLIHVCLTIDSVLSEAKLLYNKLHGCVCIKTKLYAINMCTYEKKVVISLYAYHYPHHM